MNRRTVCLALAALVAAALAARCTNPFSTRTPETPVLGRVELPDPTTSQIVVENIELAWEAGLSDRYLESLSEEDFEFVPDPIDRGSFPGELSEPWRFDQEQAFAQRLLESGDTTLEFLTPGPGRSPFTLLEQSQEADVYEYRYTLVIQSAGAPPDTVVGHTELYTRQDPDEQFWEIFRWEDERTMDRLPSFGGLRATR